MNLFTLIYEFYLVQFYYPYEDITNNGSIPAVDFFGDKMELTAYFALLASIITFSIIVVLCCMFIVKIVKLVGGLIR